MSKWLGYTVELFSNGQWFNIDQWHRHANGELRHRYLYTAPERDIFSSAHNELALSKERICFSDLAAETQDIICAENPAFERSTFDSWDFFIWGNLSDLEMLLQKPVENENDGYICSSKLVLALYFKNPKNFKKFILGRFSTAREADRYEKKCITKFDSFKNGYNRTKDGGTYRAGRGVKKIGVHYYTTRRKR